MLRFPAVEIGANVGGNDLDDESLAPVRDAAATLGIAIFVHPQAPILGDTFGPERIVLGSDYPFKMGVDDPLSALDPLALHVVTRRRLTADNARQFLALP